MSEIILNLNLEHRIIVDYRDGKIISETGMILMIRE